MSVRIFLIVLVICSQGVVFGQTEGFAVSDGVKIHYRSLGHGAPLLIINGGPGMNSDGFEALAQMLSRNNRVIIYDQRGTGASKLSVINSSTITMELMVKDIESLREHLEISVWTILGHSFGGMLASYYTSIYSQRVRSLILSSSGGIDLGLLSYIRNAIDLKLSESARDSITMWERRIAIGDTSYDARYRRGELLSPAYVVNSRFFPVIAHRLTQGNPKINTLIWNDLNRIDFNCEKGLTQYSGPVLIIQGKQDIVSDETALRSHYAFKNSKILLLDSCGHYGWLDKEKEYIASIESFIHSN